MFTSRSTRRAEAILAHFVSKTIILNILNAKSLQGGKKKNVIKSSEHKTTLKRKKPISKSSKPRTTAQRKCCNNAHSIK